MIANQQRSENSAAIFAARGVIRKLLLDALMVVRFPVAAILLLLEPFVGFALCSLAIILAVVSIILKISGGVPKFPFWGALGMSAGLYLISAVYALVARLILPKPHE